MVRRQSDAWAEIRELEAARAQDERVTAKAQSFTPSQVGAMAGLARAIPWARPGIVTALGQAGFKDTDPLIEWIGQREALERNNANGWVPIGERVPADPSNLRGALNAADSAGIIDEKGYLHQGIGDEDKVEAFRRVQDAFEEAGQPMPYVDENGERALWMRGPDVNGKPDWVTRYLRMSGSATYRSPTSATEEMEENVRAPQLDEPDGGGFGGDIAEGATRRVKDLLGMDAEPDEAQKAMLPGEFDPSDPLGFLQPAIQPLMIGMDAPVQELQGLFRNAYSAAKGDAPDWFESQSDLGINLGRHLRGEDMLSAGGGWFVDPNSELAKERYRREAERGKIGEHNITIGRYFADLVPGIDPGGKPFDVLSGLVDLGVQVADPTAWALGKANKGLKARTIFQAGEGATALGGADEALEAAGGFKGLRSFVSKPRADTWFDGGMGSRVLEDLTADSNPYSVWVKTNRRLNPRTAVEVAESTNPAHIRNIFEPMLGREYRSTGEVWKDYKDLLADSPVRSPAQAHRLLNRVPGRKVDLLDDQDAMVQAEAWMSNAKFEPQQTDYFMNRMARSATASEKFKVLEDIMGETNGILARAGVDDAATRSQVTRMWADTHKDVRHYNVGAMGDDVPTKGITLAGEQKDIAPHLYSELINQYVPLPDFRPVRRLTGNKALRLMMSNAKGGQRMPLVALNWLQDEIWKPAQLLRLAYPVRVIAEEQMRMAASQMDSVFRHPISFLAWSIGKKGNRDVLGNAIEEADDFAKAMTRTGRGSLGPGVRRGAATTIYRKDAHELDGYLDGWAGELAQLHVDPVAKHILRHPEDETVEWMMRGGGNGFRRELRDAGADVADEGGVRAYVRTVRDRIDVKTGGHTELLDALRTGNVRNASILDPDQLSTTSKFRGILAKDDILEAGPDAVKGHALDFFNQDDGNRFIRWWNNATDVAFSSLMGVPTNKLSRSTTFKQKYWDRMAEVIPYVDEPTKARILAEANEAGLDGFGRSGKQALRKLSRAEARPLPEGVALKYVGPTEDEALSQLDAAQATFDNLRSQLDQAPTGNRVSPDLWPNTDPRTREVIAKIEDIAEGRGDVSLVELRRELGDEFTRDEVDKALKAMARGDTPTTHNLTTEPNAKSLTDEDRAAALYVGGDYRHMVQVGRTERELDPAQAALQEQLGLAEEGVNEARRVVREAQAVDPDQIGRADDFLTAEEADQYAKAYALDETRRLLYDMSERSQLGDAMKLVAPFGEAWKEVVTRWLDLGTLGPGVGRALPGKPVRRFQQVIQGARGEGAGEVLGAPEVYDPETGQYEQKGFFYRNQWNEEVFAFPGSAWVVDQLIDVPNPLTGRVGGLNFMSQVLPGLGPVVTVPTAWFLSDDPQSAVQKNVQSLIRPLADSAFGEGEGIRGIRETILPFGSPIEEGEAGQITQLLTWTPGWFRKAVLGTLGGGWDADSQGAYNNSVMEMATYLRSVGGYDMSTKAGQQKLLEDAKKKANDFYLIQAFAQFGAPTAPSPEWVAETKDGKLLATWVLRDEYYRLQQEDYDTAAQKFLQRFGPDLALVMQPKTRTTTQGLESTQKFGDWARENENLSRDYPNTYGFFGPQGGEHDQAIYIAQIKKGDRERLNPEEWLNASQHTLGSLLMERARRMVGPNRSDKERVFLRAVEAGVREHYPGYGDFSGMGQRADLDTQMTELQQLVDDPTMRDNTTAKKLRTYFRAVQIAQSSAESKGLDHWEQAEATLRERAFVRAVGERLGEDDQGFDLLFNQVLSRQFNEPEEDELATA